MGDEYDTVPLGDVACVRSGFAFKSSDWAETGIPVVKIANIKDGNLVMDGCSFVPQAIADSAAEFALQAGDILIAMTGYIGDVAIVRERDLPAVLNQRVGRFSIRDPRRLDPRFLFYLLRDNEVRKEIEGLGYGSAQPNVSPSLIHGVEVPLPPLPEQRAIAHILGTLDDKIEVNWRMNQTLEAMARALFKAWFVDFEPVRAKMEGRWQRGQSLPGLPAHLYDLFPDRLVDSELGEIPEGWEVLQLADLLVESDQRIGETRAPEYSSTNNGLQLRSERFKKTLATSSAKNKLIRRGYLVFGLSRRVLNFGLMRDEIGSVSSAYKVFRVREEILYPDLLERLMRLKSTYFYMAVSSSSREGQSVSSEGLKLLRVVVPPRGIQDAFYSFDTGFTKRISAIEAESRTLAALRDALLPKHISGELRVKDAERFLKERGI
jgi:type I restriction enzyme S subunit